MAGFVAKISCADKQRFPSRSAALFVLQKQKRKGDRKGKDRHPLTTFLCTACGGWHVGGVDPVRGRMGAESLGEYGGLR